MLFSKFSRKPLLLTGNAEIFLFSDNLCFAPKIKDHRQILVKWSSQKDYTMYKIPILIQFGCESSPCKTLFKT